MNFSFFNGLWLGGSLHLVPAATATLASVSTLSATGSLAYSGAGALAAVSTLSASGSVANAGITGLASVCTLTASGSVAYAGAAALASVSTLAGDGAYSGPAGAALTSACTLVGAGHYSAGAGGSRCVLRGSGHVASVGSVAMAGACTLRGVGQGQPPLIFEEALAQRLLANGVIVAVAGGRVVPGMIPQKTPLPCVTYAVPSKPRVPDLSGPAGIARARVNISCWAHKYGDAKTLARGVVAGIPIGFTGLLGTGVTITDTYHLNEMDTYEEPDNASDVGTYRVMFEIRMDYREAF